MFNFFKKKQRQLEIRDVLFGDLPSSQWPNETASTDEEPWFSFVKARNHLNSGRKEKAILIYQNIVAMPKLESRHYIQAWHFLREVGVQPDSNVAKQLLGVVVEVSLPAGLDIVSAYADNTARYFNHSGASVVWDAPDNSLREEIENLLGAAKVVVDEIGPWEELRPPAPPTGQARISMLTPSGLHFGQASFDALAGEQLGGAVFSTATQLMKSLVAKTKEEQA